MYDDVTQTFRQLSYKFLEVQLLPYTRQIPRLHATKVLKKQKSKHLTLHYYFNK